MAPACLDKWRSFFRSAATTDIFEVIEHAIAVAASDFPKELRVKRDQIAERLFSCRFSRCSGCNRVELSVAENRGASGAESEHRKSEVGVDDDVYIDIEGDDDDNVPLTDKATQRTESNSNDPDEKKLHKPQEESGKYFKYEDAEALTNEIEEESQVFEEVMRIKNFLRNYEDESQSAIYDALRRLQLMALNFDILKATEIGKVVNELRKHTSDSIRNFARSLVNEWKSLVDEWYLSTQSLRVSEGTPESMNPSTVVDEDGLPSPPLDDGVFFATQADDMELSKFFDGIDDDGHPQNTRKPQRQSAASGRKREPVKSANPSNRISGPGRPIKPDNIPKPRKETAMTNPPASQQPKLKQHTAQADDQRKLEATKRKLNESYEQAKMAKRQRTIKLMDPQDLPKHGKAPAGRSAVFNRTRR